jgi:dGTPase
VAEQSLAPAGPRIPAGYGVSDVERLVAEGPKNPDRTAFARDRARVVQSSALRRLAGKTQVLTPRTDDFVRNRLTHSLEVAQIGRELGQSLGADPDIVDAACLAHDLGHPPFGHDGETVLDSFAAACGGFEGNAQTLRLLTRLEAKSTHADGRSAGLNLTRAVLDASVKYPWRRPTASPADGRRVKFGVYTDDEAAFAWLREPVPVASGGAGPRRCLEAQVMDFADDVAYSVHDVEDAIAGRALDLAVLDDPDAIAAITVTCRDWYDPAMTADEVVASVERLRSQPWWGTIHYDGTRASLAALKDLTSRLIGRFCAAADRATRENSGGGLLTRYAADLTVPRETVVEVILLKGLAAHYVMSAPVNVERRSRQRDLLAELADVVLAGAPGTLEPAFAGDFAAAADDAERLRVVTDQIASLTDDSAITWHFQLADR